MTEAELKDNLLSFLKTTQKFETDVSICEELEISKEMAVMLIDKISKDLRLTITNPYGNIQRKCKSNESGEMFLKSGGYTKVEKDKEQRQNKTDQIANLTIDKLVDDIVESPKIKNRLLRAEVISGVSALAAILTVILSLSKC